MTLARAEWAEALADLEGEEIKRALGYARQHAVWPPRSPAQFRQWARPGGALYHREFVALPKPKADPGIGREQLAAMRAALEARGCG